MIENNAELEGRVDDAVRADDYADFQVAQARMADLGRDLTALFLAGRLKVVDAEKQT